VDLRGAYTSKVRGREGRREGIMGREGEGKREGKGKGREKGVGGSPQLLRFPPGSIGVLE